MEKIKLKKNEDRRIRRGHLWIFSNEIDNPDRMLNTGDAVEVYDTNDSFIGMAFYNKNSLIAGRIFSYVKTDDIKSVLREKIMNAYELRKNMYPGRDSYRMVFSESDYLPGLIIDKYNDTFVMQVYSAGIEARLEMVVEVLLEIGAKNIFCKNEEYFRTLEGLPLENKVYAGEIKPEIISDGKIKFGIDFAGQKTGFYFDQSDNRFFIEKIVKDKDVLDAFCNNGGFGLHAESAGAKSICFVDSSKDELVNVVKNYELNNFDKSKAEIVHSDIFDYLEKCINAKKKFDVVMLDPPAFAKNKKSITKAKKGYEKLNRWGMKCLKDGGYLVTSSCSFHLKEEDFFEVISIAASKENLSLQVIHFNNASLDHPQLTAMEESSYLKFCVLKVVKRNNFLQKD